MTIRSLIWIAGALAISASMSLPPKIHGQDVVVHAAITIVGDNSMEPAQRRLAALELKARKTSSKTAINALRICVASSNGPTLVAAAEALGEIGSAAKDAVPELVEKLNADSHDLIALVAVLEALAKIGHPTQEALAKVNKLLDALDIRMESLVGELDRRLRPVDPHNMFNDISFSALNAAEIEKPFAAIVNMIRGSVRGKNPEHAEAAVGILVRYCNSKGWYYRNDLNMAGVPNPHPGSYYWTIALSNQRNAVQAIAAIEHVTAEKALAQLMFSPKSAVSQEARRILTQRRGLENSRGAFAVASIENRDLDQIDPAQLQQLIRQLDDQIERAENAARQCEDEARRALSASPPRFVFAQQMFAQAREFRELANQLRRDKAMLLQQR